MTTIISKKVKSRLFFVAYRSFQTGFVLYRLIREAFLPVMVILDKLNNIMVYKNKWVKKKIQESSDADFSSWSNHTPQDIAEIILQKLPLNDYLRFGTVCSSWRSIVTQVIAEKRCTPAPQLPLLMFCAHPYTNRNHCFLSLSSNRIFYAPNWEKLHRRNCDGAVEGWLIMADGILWRPEGDFCSPPGFESVKNFFLNPVSGARVMLPSQTTLSSLPQRSVPDLFARVVASTVPTSPNCIVAALCLQGNLAFCRPADKSWTLYGNEQGLRFEDMVFHDGQLYAITKKLDFIVVFELEGFSQGCRSPRTRVLVMLPPRPDLSYRRRVEGTMVYSYNVPMCHLVKDHTSNDLLMIIHFSDGAANEEYSVEYVDYVVPPRIKSFQVFKLEQQSGPRWVQIHSLGDRIVFLSQLNCMIVSTALVGKAQNELSGNCIYFALDYPCTTSPEQGRDVGVFCLEDGSIRHHFPSVPRSWLTLLPVWFTPNPW